MPLKLNTSLYIASGATRDVYTHPENPDACIKIEKSSKKARKQNYRESRFLANSSGSSLFPRYFGELKTNLGHGMVVELIRDFNGEISKSLPYYLENGVISRQEALAFIDEIKSEVRSNRYLISDAGLSNILLQKDQNGCFTPKMIDGFGPKKSNVLYFLRNCIAPMRMYKTNKQLKSMFRNIVKI